MIDEQKKAKEYALEIQQNLLNINRGHKRRCAKVMDCAKYVVCCYCCRKNRPGAQQRTVSPVAVSEA